MFTQNFRLEQKGERLNRSIIFILLFSVNLAGCGKEGEKEAAVKTETTESQIIIKETQAETTATKAAKPIAISAPVKKKTGKFTVQIGAFRSEQRAIEARSKYKSMGYDAYMEKTTVGGKEKAWYRVRIGRFQRIREAEKVSRELNARGNIKAWVDRIRG